MRYASCKIPLSAPVALGRFRQLLRRRADGQRIRITISGRAAAMLVSPADAALAEAE